MCDFKPRNKLISLTEGRYIQEYNSRMQVFFFKSWTLMINGVKQYIYICNWNIHVTIMTVIDNITTKQFYSVYRARFQQKCTYFEQEVLNFTRIYSDIFFLFRILNTSILK